MVRQGQTALNAAATIGELLAWGSAELQCCSDSPRLDADLLMSQALDVTRSFLFAHAGDELDDAALDRYRSLVAARASGKPLAYIVGEKEFWSMVLTVTPAVLVPRPDTEVLVEHVLRKIPLDSQCGVLDLGTGSGAIALAIAKERPACRIIATDSSTDALAVARDNANRHSLGSIEFRHGDWCEPVLNEEFDVIVTNPPYVAENDPHLENLQFEPNDALVSGTDGMTAIRMIVTQAREIARNETALFIEHGADQAKVVSQKLRDAGWCDVESAIDLAGNDRMSTATWKSAET